MPLEGRQGRHSGELSRGKTEPKRGKKEKEKVAKLNLIRWVRAQSYAPYGQCTCILPAKNAVNVP